MVLGESIDRHTNLEALVESFVVGVVGGHLGNQPQLLRIRCHQWRAHHKWSGGQYVFIVGAACVGQQCFGIYFGGRGYRRSGQTDEYAETEACKER